MIRRVPRCFLAVGIVTALSACDNVSWGGIRLRLQGPAEDTTASLVESPDTATAESRPMRLGPLLYAGVREGDSVRLQAVAELSPQGMRPLPVGVDGADVSLQILDSRMRPGNELALFYDGARVGTAVLGEGRVTTTQCDPRPLATGHLELIPSAGEVQRFLALEKGPGSGWTARAPELLRDTYDQRVASLTLGSEAISQSGAPWPPSLLETREDLQVFRLDRGADPAIMATFLHKDRLQVAAAPPDAYSLLILGEPRGAGYRLAFSWYRPVGEAGKGAPRFFAHLDWDGDGEEEILLEVLGEASRWWAALDRGPEGWGVAFQDPCGRPGGTG